MSEGQGTATTTTGTEGNSSAQSQGTARPSGQSLESGALQKAPDGSARGAPSTESKREEAAITAEVRKLKLNLYGKDQELPESEVIKLAQQSIAHQKRAMEAAKKEKEFQQTLQAMKNPAQLRSTLLKMGYTEDQIDDIAEQTLADKVKKRMLSPEQLKALEMEDELKRYKSKEKEEEDQKKAKEYAEVVAAERANLDRQMTDAMNESGLPRTAFTVDRYVKYMKKAINMGYEHVQAKDVTNLVKEDYKNEYSYINDGIQDMQQLVDLLGPKLVERIRKFDLEKLKNPNAPQKFSVEPNAKPSDPEAHDRSKKKLSKAEWNKLLDSRV